MVNGTSKLNYVSIAAADINPKDQEVYFTADFLESEGNEVGADFSFTNGFVGTLEGGNGPSDSFFVSAPYKGAVSASDDWTAGWVLR